MQKEQRFYLIWHLVTGMVTSCIFFAFGLHYYSQMQPGLSFPEQIWYTITVLFPSWSFIMIPAGLVIAVISWAVYGLLSGKKPEAKYLYWLICGGAGVWTLVFNVYALAIWIPLLLSGLLLKWVENRD